LRPIRTISEVDLEFTAFVSDPFRYQEISDKVRQLYELGMNCHQISDSLGEEYKTIKRSLKWCGILDK
jgi:transposase-like protein